MNAPFFPPGANPQINIAALALLAFAVCATPPAVFGDTYTVNNTADTLTAGTLRQAITNANAHSNSLNPGGVPDNIAFAIPGAGVKTISPTSSLPAITDPVVINGYTQPGSAQNSAPNGFNGMLLIELNGTSAGADVYGLTIDGGKSTIRGLVINRFTNTGILLNSADNLIAGNFIGVNPAGTAALGNGSQGVRVDSGNSNTIGGTAPAARNVISGNGEGIEIRGVCNSNRVQGNFIGTNASGTGALGNGSNGIRIVNGPTGTTVGGTVAGARNVISANSQTGVIITSSTASDSFVQGNFIGTDVTGTAKLSNTLDGVAIDGSPRNTVGGTVAGARNIISGNNGDGVAIATSAATLNIVRGNFIGTDVKGTAPLGNHFNGVRMNGAPNNRIGGTTPRTRNIISGNEENGVSMIGPDATKNRVQGNFIGTDVTGKADLGNIDNGIVIYNATGNTIGGIAAGAGNVISANNNNGVLISPEGATKNKVQGNFIGTDVTGNAKRPNAHTGVVIQDGANNTIGGSKEGAGNLISGNNDDGIFIEGPAASGNRILGNLIGTKANGIGALGNKDDGVDFGSSNPASNNIVGGPADGAPNIVAFNGDHGVLVSGGTGNGLFANSIFANGSLGIDIDNGGITSNDTCDGDNGVNKRQNFPALTASSSGKNITNIQGVFNSAANTQFRIEFYNSPQCDASGFGEGKTLIGAINVTTNANCQADFDLDLPRSVKVGSVITATATDPADNTSEFSNCAVVAGPKVSVAVAPIVVKEGENATFTVSAKPAPSEPLVVRYSMSGNAKPGTDYNLSGTLEHVTIPAGKPSAKVVLHARPDQVNDDAEKVIMTIEHGNDYRLGAITDATVTISSPNP